MTREEKIEIVKKDVMSLHDAKRYVDTDHCIVYEDLAENLESYLKEWFPDEEDDADLIDDIREMIRSGKPAQDWGVVEANGRTYYIEYFF